MNIAKIFYTVLTGLFTIGLLACDAKDPFSNSGIEIGIDKEEEEDGPKTYKIMPIGDSLTEAADPGYRGYLYKQLTAAGYPVDFVGVKQNEPANGGDPDHSGFAGYVIGPDANSKITNGDIYSNLDGGYNILSIDCDIILLLIGTNDFWNIDHDAANYYPWDGPVRLEALVEKIYSIKPDVTILVSNITPLREDLTDGWNTYDGFNQGVPAIIEGQKEKGRSCYFVDARYSPDWNPETDYPTNDNLHFAASGYEKLAGAFYNVLVPLLVKEETEN